jgi:hypothetical protein
MRYIYFVILLTISSNTSAPQTQYNTEHQCERLVIINNIDVMDRVNTIVYRVNVTGITTKDNITTAQRHGGKRRFKLSRSSNIIIRNRTRIKIYQIIFVMTSYTRRRRSNKHVWKCNRKYLTAVDEHTGRSNFCVCSVSITAMRMYKWTSKGGYVCTRTRVGFLGD